MFKKSISLLLAIAVMIGSGLTAAAAVPTGSNELDDASNWTGSYWSDDFSSYSEDVDLSTSAGYPSGSCTSDVFATSTAATDGTLVDADGGRNGAGLVMTSGTSAGNSLVWDSAKLSGMNDEGYGNIVVCKYDVKFSGLSNLSGEIHLSGASTGAGSRKFLRVHKDGEFRYYDVDNATVMKRATLTEGSWYHVMVVWAKTAGAEEGSYYEVREAVVYDAEGNLVIEGEMDDARTTVATGTSWNNSCNQYQLTVPMCTQDTCTVSVDNASLSMYKMSSYAPELTATPAIANTVVEIADLSVNVTFDQPIGGTPTATLKNLTDAAAADEICYATKTGKTTASWVIEVPDSALADGTNYKLVLDGFKNLGEAASTDYVVFATEERVAADEAVTASFDTAGEAKSYGSGSFDSNNPLISYSRGSSATASVADGMLSLSGIGEYGWLNAKSSPVNLVHPKATPIYFSDTDKAYVLTYKMRVNEPASGELIADCMAGVMLQSSSDEGADIAGASNVIANFQTNANGNVIQCENAEAGSWTVGTWYEVIWSVADGVQTYRLYNAETWEPVFESTRDITGIDSDNPTAYWAFSLLQQGTVNCWGNDGYDNGHEKEIGTACTAGFSIDDVTLWRLDRTQDWSMPRFAENKVDGETVTLTFDQPLLTTGADYTVTNKATGEVEQGVTASVVQVDEYSQRLSFDGLDYNATYTLNYKDIKNIAGNDVANKNDTECVPEITFTTGAYDAADGYLIAGNPVVAGKTQGSTVGLNIYCPEAKTGAVFVAFYGAEDNLLGVEKYALNAAAAGKVAGAGVTLSRDYSNAASVKIFAWTNELQPEILPTARTLASS